MIFYSVILPIILFGKAKAFDKDHLDLTAHILQSSPLCVTVLYRFNALDANEISRLAKSTVLIVNDIDPKLQERLQEFLSTGRSRCVTLLADQDRLDNIAIEDMLNRTTHRSVVVYNASSGGFRKYFQDSVINVQSLASGNLLLTKSMPADSNPTRIMIWLRKEKRLVTPDHIDYTLSTNAARSNLRNKIVIVSAVAFYPYVTFLPNKTYGGVEIEIVNVLAKKMGFSYVVKEEKKWEGKDPVTHKRTDMAGSIRDGISQLGLSFSITGYGETTPVAHTPHIYSHDFIYLVPKPRPLQPFNNFVRPFTLSVWIGFIISLFLCSLLASLLIRNDKDRYGQTIWTIFFDLFGTLWQQKMEDTLVSPNSGTYFVIFGFWIVGMTFKGAAYNCDLRSFIVKKVYEKPIETDQDLVNSGLELFISDGTGLPQYYKQSKSPQKKAIYDKAVKENTIYPYFYNASKIQDRILLEGGAKLTTKVRSQYELTNFESKFGFQPFRPTRSVSFSWQGTIGMPYNRPWSEEVNTNLLRIAGTGIVEMLTKRMFPITKYSHFVEKVEEEEALEPYRIEHVAGPLMTLGFGLAISVAIADIGGLSVLLG